MPLDDMLRELDRFMSRIQSLSRYRPLAESMLSMWNGGPQANVTDQGDTVKVLIEAPGIPKELRQRWAMRLKEDALLIRGELKREQAVRRVDGRMAEERSAQQFVRVVPMPWPVERKPVSVKYQDGLLTVVLKKRKTQPEDGWVDLSF